MILRQVIYRYLLLLPIFVLFSSFSMSTSNSLQRATTTVGGKSFEPVLAFGHENLPIQIVRWHPTDNQLAVAYSGYSNIEIFNTDSRKLETTLNISLPVPGVPANDLEWSPDGQYLAVTFETAIMLWKVGTAPVPNITFQNSGYGPSISWSPDSKKLADVRGSDSDRRVTVWDVQTGKQVISMKSSSQQVAEIAWSPDGNLIATTTYSGDVLLWNSKTFTLSKTISGQSAEMFFQGPLVWNSNSHNIAGVDCTNRGFCRLWLINAATGQITLPANIMFIPGPVNSLAWSKDGRLLAGDNGDKSVQIFDLIADMPIQTLEKYTDLVLSVAWNFDSTLLATGGLDGLVQIWKIEPS